MLRSACVLSCLVAVLAITRVVPDDFHKTEAGHTKADQNGDKKLSHAEVAGVMIRHSIRQYAKHKPIHADEFKVIDTNGDGVLDLKELNQENGNDPTFKKADENGDGVLNPYEYETWFHGGHHPSKTESHSEWATQYARDVMKTQDEDRDGHLTLDELHNVHEGHDDFKDMLHGEAELFKELEGSVQRD